MNDDERKNCFFSRGDGPLVSILIPSRGSPDGLRRTVLSCIEKAQDPTRLEFCFKVDEDDDSTIETVRGLGQEIPSTIICQVGPRGRGYPDIHYYLNGLASQAHGDWLFILNDDVGMLSDAWDAQLLNATVASCWHACPHEVYMLWCLTVGSDGAEVGFANFFLLRRRTYEILGFVCQSPYGDAWLRNVMEPIHCQANAKDLRIQHFRDGDRWPERVGIPWSDGTGTLASVGANLTKLAASTRLLAYIERYESMRPWIERPLHPGWNRWRTSLSGDPLHAYVREDGQVALLRGASPTVYGTVVGMEGLWQSR